MKRKIRGASDMGYLEIKDTSASCESSPIQEHSPRKKYCALRDLEAPPEETCPRPKPKRTYGKRVYPVSIESKERSANSVVVLPNELSEEFHPCLSRQKQAILTALCEMPAFDKWEEYPQDLDEDQPANIIALNQVADLLEGCIERNEGNSCVIFGPPGSGKTKIFESALHSKIANCAPIVIRLNGLVHHTDRLAMKEIARQVVQQSGNKEFETINAEDEDDPFADRESIAIEAPPAAHLPSLIGALPSLQRPVIVLLDAFEQFTLQPRQALLYCLLDTVQSCRTGSLSQRGMAVVGITTRIDVVNLLEKRVKSRFSHRLIRTSSLKRVDNWIMLLRSWLLVNVPSHEKPQSIIEQWQKMWMLSIRNLFEDRSFKDFLNDVFCLTRDIRILLHATRKAIVRLSPTAAFLTTAQLRIAFNSQRSPPISTTLTMFSYPSMALLIASQHARTAGYDIFTFEHLHHLFTTQVRASSAAPVMFGGGGIGMVSVSRALLLDAFGDLIRAKIFVRGATAQANLAREFVKYRCAVEWSDVKTAVERVGQTSLRKWFSKSQV